MEQMQVDCVYIFRKGTLLSDEMWEEWFPKDLINRYPNWVSDIKKYNRVGDVGIRRTSSVDEYSYTYYEDIPSSRNYELIYVGQKGVLGGL